jgi:hypothetical protein
MSADPNYTDLPLKIVGSTKFGRYPWMSSEETFNMIMSDDNLVPFAGYRRVLEINPTGDGRGIDSSSKNGKQYAVIDNDIWAIEADLSYTFIGSLTSYVGDVYIAENNGGQLVFSDSVNLYVYNYITDDFAVRTPEELGFKPGYITFQDGRFITPDLLTNEWRLSDENNGLSWPTDAQHVGSISTKATRGVGCVRFPGKGNLLLVLGETVGEFWINVGGNLFPYQRNQSSNIDYGCVNAATIAANESIVCWVGANEQSGPVIMMTEGAGVRRISTDGIDYKLSQLKNPNTCYGFMVRLVGHLCYVVTWPLDNLTYLYDFNTESFFTLCDEKMNAFIVKRVAFFNNKYYFVSLTDGNLYELSADLFTYDYGDGHVAQIPYIRIPPSVKFPDSRVFTVGYVVVPVEQGNFDYATPETDNVPRIDLCISKDGGVNYGSNVARTMFPQGRRASRVRWLDIGRANDLTPQFRFQAYGRFIAKDGVIGIRQ